MAKIGAGDASGFRPPSDFGDAPSSYDPVALSPALHMKDTTLRLGPTWDQEFSKFVSANADGDGSDEDGILTVNLMDTALSNYIADLRIYNNTGSNATVIGWLDINGNGTFEASEAISANVPQGGPVLQNVRLSWLGINTPLTEGLKTFLRIRLTSSSNGMTVSNPTGYFPNGELEDYPVHVASVLPVRLINFEVKAEDGLLAQISWNAENEINISRYEIQKSKDGALWQTINSRTTGNRNGSNIYELTDNAPLSGKSFYRLKMIEFSGKYYYSKVVTLFIEMKKLNISLFPNPVDRSTELLFKADENSELEIKIYTLAGIPVQTRRLRISKGENNFPLGAENFPIGIYILHIETKPGIKKLRFIKKSIS